MIERSVSCHLVTWQSFADGLAGAGGLGFAGCETFASVAVKYADSLGDKLADAGLRLSAVYAGGSFVEADADAQARRALVESHAELARLVRGVGCDRIVLGPGPWRGLARPDMRVVAPVVQEVARAVADEGVVACLHPHRGTEVASGAEVLAVLERDASGFVAVCPDTAHLAVAGDDPARVVRACAERVAAVHFKDVTEDGWFCELGAGTVDVPGVFEALDDIGFHGWVTVEMEDTDTPTESVRACRDYLAGLGRFEAVRA
jgi:inosose dehydratase